jgi:hypothetical protein
LQIKQAAEQDEQQDARKYQQENTATEDQPRF